MSPTGQVTLTQSPRLAPLYVRAALGARVHRGDVLPGTHYTLADRPTNADTLADYQRVCGFRVGDTVPATYPHIVAFPLSMQLMVQRDFPFALPGLVHVANSIIQHRPLRLGESVTVRVWTADMWPHPAGRQFDLVAEAAVDQDTVWTSRSTYLHRDRAADRPTAQRAESQPPAGTATIWRVPGDIGRRYAAVSGDRNPIHLGAATAKAFGFPRAIAHGMWLAARGLASLEGRLGDGFRYEVAFKTPVLLPARVALTTSGDRRAWTLDLRDARSGKPHLTGTVTATG
jgi:acyl dehydratase